jgi:flagellar basal-body rod modification protein FlgD
VQINAASNDPTAPITTSAQDAGLGKNDFLKLLVGQLRNQNPLDPMGDQDFIQQMTMFSTLEQVTNLAAAGERITGALGDTQALGLIGRTVTYVKADGTSAEGVVEQVTFGEDGGPKLTVGGQTDIDPAAVTEVR